MVRIFHFFMFTNLTINFKLFYYLFAVIVTIAIENFKIFVFIHFKLNANSVCLLYFSIYLPFIFNL